MFFLIIVDKIYIFILYSDILGIIGYQLNKKQPTKKQPYGYFLFGISIWLLFYNTYLIFIQIFYPDDSDSYSSFMYHQSRDFTLKFTWQSAAKPSPMFRA